MKVVRLLDISTGGQLGMREEKKSETLEVRLPYSQKIAFMNACKREGISASEALRAGIAEFLDAHDRQSQRSNPLKEVVTLMRLNTKKTIGSLMALSLGTAIFAAMPSAAEDELFAKFDKNDDGVLTAGEISKNDGKVFEVLDTNGDGQISADEFQREAQISQTSDTIEQDDDGNDVRIIAYELTQIRIKDDGHAEVMASKWAESVAMDADQAEVDALLEDMKSKSISISEQSDFNEMLGLTEEEIITEGGKKIIIRKEIDGEGMTEEELSEFKELAEFIEIEKEIAENEGKTIIIKKEIRKETSED